LPVIFAGHGGLVKPGVKAMRMTAKDILNPLFVPWRYPSVAMATLKQQLLLFDRVWFCSLNMLEQMMPTLIDDTDYSAWTGEEVDVYMSTIHYLIDEGSAVDYPHYHLASDAPDIRAQTISTLKALSEQMRIHGADLIVGSEGKQPHDRCIDMRSFIGIFDCITRFYCAVARDVHELPISPLVFTTSLGGVEQVEESADVLRIILKALPLPSATTPTGGHTGFQEEPQSPP
jgi:hypothetical protein